MVITPPVPGRITSPIGAPRSGHIHQGVDLSAGSGEPISAAAAGVVFKAGQISANAGLGVEINHGDGIVTKYFHMSSVLAAVGQQVSQGQRIGLVGATGDAKGPHLHFEIWLNGAPVDPAPYLAGQQGGPDTNSLVQVPATETLDSQLPTATNESSELAILTPLLLVGIGGLVLYLLVD